MNRSVQFTMDEYDKTGLFPIANCSFGEMLEQLSLDSRLFWQKKLSGDWSLEMPVQQNKMMFHIVTAGECWIQIDQDMPKLLKQGVLVLLPDGREHTLTSKPQNFRVPCFNAEITNINQTYCATQMTEKAELTYGVVDFDLVAGQQLIRQLPSVLIFDQLEECSKRWLNGTLEFIAAEAKFMKFGDKTMITRMINTLVIQLIRYWTAQLPKVNRRKEDVLKDKHIGIALRTIHHHPEKNWTVELLAKECGMSRSGFSTRFTLLVGKSVKSYLTEWRMNLAHQRLKQKSIPLIILAEELGYQSEAAFSRAFKRVIGVSPGKV